MHQSKISDFVTPAEAAALLGVHLSAIYFAIKQGNLPTVEALGKTVLRRSDVEAYTPRPNKRRQKQKEKEKEI